MKTLATFFATAGVLLAGSAFSAGLSTAFENAGVKKGSIAYHKLLNSMNISSFNVDAQEASTNSFKLCKRRWLTSPAGSFSGLTVEGELKLAISAGEDQETDEVTGTFSETLENVTDGGFDLKFAMQMGDDKKQEGVMKVTRAEYIVTCQEVIEGTREMEKDLLIVTRYGEPRLMRVKTETESYQTIANMQTQSGFLDEATRFEVQLFSADANFGVYRKSLMSTDLLVVKDQEDKIENIMAMSSKVTKVSVK